MKKMLIPALLLLAAAVSCQREKNVDPKEAVEITVTAGVPETRTYIENDGTAWIPYWNTGDVLGVMVDEDYGSNVSLTNTAEPGRTGSFSGTLKEGVTDGEHTLTAWYPKALRVGRAESVLKYLLAEEQTLPSLTSFDPDMDLLVGMPATFVVTDRKANVDNMRFRRVFTVVKVTLKDESTLLAGKKVSRVVRSLPNLAFLAAGIWVLVNPVMFENLIHFVLGITILIFSLKDLILAIRAKKEKLWLILPVIGIVLGILILVNPFGSFRAFAVFAGIALLYTGAASLVNEVRSR